jgi:hypothetical protein
MIKDTRTNKKKDSRSRNVGERDNRDERRKEKYPQNGEKRGSTTNGNGGTLFGLFLKKSAK